MVIHGDSGIQIIVDQMYAIRKSQIKDQAAILALMVMSALGQMFNMGLLCYLVWGNK